MKNDLRSFLASVEQKAPEPLVRVTKGVSPQWELSCVQKRLEAEGRLPILLFEDIQGSSLPIVTHLFAVAGLAGK
jgi:UbiD family decarboxylase